MTLTPTELHETLDERGLLEHAQGPATYGLKVDTPDTVDDVTAAFIEVCGHSPKGGVCEQIAQADRTAYVGASNYAYDRLEDHAEGIVRQATFLQAFELTNVIGVWPAEQPFEAEFNRAQMLALKGWRVWCDGDLI